MREIKLNAARWTKAMDFYHALLPALGAPAGHGRSVDALIDSMVWGGMNAVDPPYTVQVYNTQDLPDDVREELLLVSEYLALGREEFRAQEEQDVEVSLKIVS